MGGKRENFERLAEKRVTEALKIMRLIGNLSNRRNYDYTEMHVKEIVDALEAELRQLKNRFREGTQHNNCVFSFKKCISRKDEVNTDGTK